MKYITGIIAIMAILRCQAQDLVYSSNIKTPQLFGFGNQLAYPILRLNSMDQLELTFDDLDADVKNYSYTFILCNADWTPAEVSEFDYIKGFSQVTISDYHLSSVALTKYTHYRAVLPDPNSVPIHSGNFILKVFLNGDTSQLAFTRRFLVVENGVNIAATILQPQNPAITRTHQKIELNINTRNLNITSPFEQVKVWILQNNRWDNAIHDIQPAFYSGNVMQFNSDDAFNFPGGNEWRWVDILGTFHFQSDRVQNGIYGNNATTLVVRPDGDRSKNPYYFYKDLNGLYYIQTTESINPNWQTDYATLKFTYVPADHAPIEGKDVYIFGAMTGYLLNDSTKMIFNPAKGAYEGSVFLKQGFYNYTYVTIDQGDHDKKASFEWTEGNHLETENEYSILVYYRPLGGRADQLVGLARLNTLNTR